MRANITSMEDKKRPKEGDDLFNSSGLHEPVATTSGDINKSLQSGRPKKGEENEEEINHRGDDSGYDDSVDRQGK